MLIVPMQYPENYIAFLQNYNSVYICSVRCKAMLPLAVLQGLELSLLERAAM